MKRIVLRIYDDGRVNAEVQGIQGKSCSDYIGMIEDILSAETVQSRFTNEYLSSLQEGNENIISAEGAISSLPNKNGT